MARWVGVGTQQPSVGFEPATSRSQVQHRTTRPPHTLTKTKRETELFSKTETKYKRKSGRTKRNINWNENDFKTKMITYTGKNRHISASIWFCHLRLDQQTTKVTGAVLVLVLHCKNRLTMQYLHGLRARATPPEEDAITFWSRRQAALSNACPTGPRPGSCASIPGLRRTRVLRMQMAYSWPQKQTV